MTITPATAAAASSSLNISDLDDKTWYIISALVEDKPGVLLRITITTESDEKTLDQLVKQLRKLIDVVEVKVLDIERTVYRELALIKMRAVDPTTRMEITNFASVFRANILDIGKETITVELTGTPDKIEAFKNLVDHFGIIQLARTGVLALPRGIYS